MTVFVTSDTHIGHRGILSFCGDVRQFEDVTEMNKELVRRWNAVVKPDDTVYHLGDVFWHAMSSAKRWRYFHMLNGKKHLIVGNHDDAKTLALPWLSTTPGVKVLNERDGLHVTLCHYPPNTMGKWQRSGNSIWLHGHIHSMIPQSMPVYDVGVDANGLAPIKLNKLVRLAEEYFESRQRGIEKLKLKRGAA
jgi:calcineurin-like phosphoesterase family protein